MKMHPLKPQAILLFSTLQVPHDLIATICAAAHGLPSGYYVPTSDFKHIFLLSSQQDEVK